MGVCNGFVCNFFGFWILPLRFSLRGLIKQEFDQLWLFCLFRRARVCGITSESEILDWSNRRPRCCSGFYFPDCLDASAQTHGTSGSCSENSSSDSGFAFHSRHVRLVRTYASKGADLQNVKDRWRQLLFPQSVATTHSRDSGCWDQARRFERRRCVRPAKRGLLERLWPLSRCAFTFRFL